MFRQLFLLLVVILPFQVCAEDYHENRADAYQHCQQESSQSASTSIIAGDFTVVGPECRYDGANKYQAGYKATSPTFGTSFYAANAQQPANVTYIEHHRFAQCPPDQPWNEVKKVCGGCTNAPDLSAGSIVPFVNNQRCSDGCVYQPKTEGQRRFDVGTPNESVFASGWSATGDVCEVETPSKPYDPDKPICKAYATGASFCLKPNGDSCYTDSAGKQLCWGSTDTGKRNTTDNKLGGDRKPQGETPTPPDNMTEPEQQHSESTTINNYNSTTNIYNGAGSAAPGQGNTGVPRDTNGDGNPDSGSGDEGDDEGTDPGSVSGGTNCSSPPQVVGGDPVAAAQLYQQWKTRCATEAQNGQPDWTKVTGDGTDGQGEEPDGPVKTVSGPISRLDQTGFGLSRSCPDFGSVNMGHFGTFDIDPDGKLCDFLIVVRGIFGIMGLLIAIKILGGN